MLCEFADYLKFRFTLSTLHALFEPNLYDTVRRVKLEFHNLALYLG